MKSRLDISSYDHAPAQYLSSGKATDPFGQKLSCVRGGMMIPSGGVLSIQCHRNNDVHGVQDDSHDKTAGFPAKLMTILNDDSLRDIISWLPSGRAFIVKDRAKLSREVLPKYFDQGAEYRSFTRRLRRWGFKRVTKGPEANGYHHPLFQRGREELCQHITWSKTRTSKSSSGKDGATVSNGLDFRRSSGVSVDSNASAALLDANRRNQYGWATSDQQQRQQQLMQQQLLASTHEMPSLAGAQRLHPMRQFMSRYEQDSARSLGIESRGPMSRPQLCPGQLFSSMDNTLEPGFGVLAAAGMTSSLPPSATDFATTARMLAPQQAMANVAVEEAKEALYQSLLRQQAQMRLNNMLLMQQKKLHAVNDLQSFITSSSAWQESLARKSLEYKKKRFGEA